MLHATARTTTMALAFLAVFISTTAGADLLNDNVFRDRFFKETLSISSDWDCPSGFDCQDVYEIDLTAGASISIEVSSVTGNSVARIAALRPGSALNSSNVILGTDRDLSCAGQNGDEQASFVAHQSGTWQIVVGRDWGLSAGSSGTYSLAVTSSLAFSSELEQADNDIESQASGFRCEHKIRGSWNCLFSEDCQDTFTVELEEDTPLQLALTNLTGNSVPRLALHEPGVSLGGINLLTNTDEDRECVGQDEADIPSPYPIDTTGSHTLAVTRDWGSSAGSDGTYVLTVSADDALFDPPEQVLDDVDSLASGGRCGWVYQAMSSWSCTLSENCQDVYDIPLQAGSTLTLEATGITGNSVARLAAFAPDTPLSGTNLLTGDTRDYSCGGQDVSEFPPPLVINDDGTHRIAFGRDWGSSAGGSGNYVGTIIVNDGYGGDVIQSVDNTDSLSSGFTCPSL